MKTHHLSETVTAVGEVIDRIRLDMAHKRAFPKPRPITLEVLIIVGSHATYKRPITIPEIQAKMKKPMSHDEVTRGLKELALFLGYYRSPVELRRRMLQGMTNCLGYWLFVEC